MKMSDFSLLCLHTICILSSSILSSQVFYQQELNYQKHLCLLSTKSQTNMYICCCISYHLFDLCFDSFPVSRALTKTVFQDFSRTYSKNSFFLCSPFQFLYWSHLMPMISTFNSHFADFQCSLTNCILLTTDIPLGSLSMCKQVSPK